MYHVRVIEKALQAGEGHGFFEEHGDRYRTYKTGKRVTLMPDREITPSGFDIVSFPLDREHAIHLTNIVDEHTEGSPAYQHRGAMGVLRVAPAEGGLKIVFAQGLYGSKYGTPRKLSDAFHGWRGDALRALLAYARERNAPVIVPTEGWDMGRHFGTPTQFQREIESAARARGFKLEKNALSWRLEPQA